MSEFLKIKYFFNEISPIAIYYLIHKNDDFLKNKNFVQGKSPSFAWIFEK
jgi:hypothetical protein